MTILQRAYHAHVEAGVLDERCSRHCSPPRHRRGVTECPGLYAVGLPWLHSEPSSVFAGVGDDAAFVVDHLIQNR